jgi:gamma-glutamyltranspeptidase/glutathione hydrolase
MKYILFICLFFNSFFILKAQNGGKKVTAQKGVVVSAHPEASKIGIEILKKGGNAFDASVATEFALAVCFPVAGNIGGGGLLVFRKQDGEIGSLDYREKAPENATKDMFLDDKKNVIPKLSTEGALAVGVPGTVAGMYELHQKFGKLKWEEVVLPAENLAKNGVILTEREADTLNRQKNNFNKINKNKKNAFVNEKQWKKGDTLKQPELAETFKIIRLEGRKGFYEGKIAQLLVKTIQENKGIINLNDLKNYRPIWRRPIIFNYREHTFITMPPPSAGGILLAQMLKMLEPFDFNKIQRNSIQLIQLLTEVERRAYSDRAKYLGDADFYNVPLDQLLHSKYLKNRMKDFSFKKANTSQQIQAGNLIPISEETTHYCVTDEWGNTISATTTLNGAFGSKLIVEGAGFFLNNEMDDFSIKPNTPNAYKLVGGDANAIVPHKRMLSSMTPTIIEKQGKVKFAIGTPGGSTITTSILQTAINLIDYEMQINEAVAYPRFHHQWLPDMIFVEKTNPYFDTKMIENLSKLGYKIEWRSPIGRVEGIQILPNGTILGGADIRGDDWAEGY